MTGPPFSNAPDFVLPSRAGAFRLHDLNGHQRVALFFARQAQAARAALSQRQQNAAEWDERDLALVLVTPAGSDFWGIAAPASQVFVLEDHLGEVGAAFGVPHGQNGFFLLGKSDFPVALATEEFPGDATIFALIDAMPMRKREMGQRRS